MREPSGFREFVETRQAALLRLAWLLTGNWQDAEDLVQVALAKVWRRWARVAAEGSPEAYVRRIIVTTHLTSRRRRWHGERPAVDLPEPVLDQDGELTRVEARDELVRALAQLPPRQRAVLVLRFYTDLSVDATARVLECTPGTIKSQTAKAMARMTATTKEATR